MRLLTLPLIAALGASLAVNPSLAARQAVRGSTDRVSVRPQPGAPLRISAVADKSDDPQAPLVGFLVENVGGRPIQAYWISYDTRAGGEDVTLGVGMNAGTKEQVLPPGGRRELGVLNRGGERIVLSVDFVEFADGTTWGEDASKHAEGLAGQRAGARAEAGRLLKLLETEGLPAVVEAAGQGVGQVGRAAESRSEQSFLFGVRAVRARVQRAYQGGGLAAVESALRQPYDWSGRSRQP